MKSKLIERCAVLTEGREACGVSSEHEREAVKRKRKFCLMGDNEKET